MEFTGSSAWNRNSLSPDAAPAVAASSNPLAAPISTLALQTRAATSLLFIEANVTDYQSLVAGVKAGTEVHILDPIADAVTQITQTLVGRTGISSLHIVSHGEAGGLQLGSTELDGQNLDRYATQIGSWSQALTADADILLYGCNVAQGSQGLAFVQRLGQMTGADIAASNDRTGDQAEGGNWTLEVHTGNIAAGLVFQASTLANYHHVLPVDLLSPIDPALVSGSDSTGGSLGTGSVSNDGRYIVFTSNSGSLDATDKNGKSDVFWLDRQTQTLKLVSHNLGKTGSSNGSSSNAVISGDGLSVAFVSDGTDLASGDQNSQKDVFLWKWDSATSTDTLRLVSGTNNGEVSSGDSYNPVISDNGQYVSFLSDATNLTSPLASNADTNNQPDVFQWDGSASTNALMLVSRNRSKNGSGNKGVSTNFSMSRDGNFVAFSSNASNLVASSIDLNGFTEDVFRWGRVNNMMTLISSSPTGANGGSVNPVISNDGSRIAFMSAATNLDALDNDNAEDIFLWDSASTIANKIRLISVNSAGTNSGNKSADPFAASGSLNPVISGDGKYVAFTSYSTDLTAAADTNNKQDVFVRDVDASTTFLVSGNSAGVFGNDVSSDPSISGDGKRISFASSASNLVMGDTNGKRDVFVHDLTDGTTSLISRSATAIGDNDSPADDPTSISVYTSAISADGNFVAFTSLASNLVNRDGNSAADVFIAQLPTVADPTSAVSLVSRQGSDPALTPKTGSEDATLMGNSVSADGRYVVYTSKAPELAPNDVNSAQDVFVRDNQTNTVTLISRNSGGSSGNGNSYSPVISRDGQFVVFVSDASDLVAGDTNGASDLFLWEQSQPNTLTLISKINGGTTSGNQASLNPIISGNGQYVVFTSLASNLVSGDGNTKQDVFVWERSTKTTTLVSHANGNSNSSDGTSENASISDDGRFITFTSDGTNLVTTPTTAQNQVFLWDRQTTSLSLISQNSAGTIANADSDNAVISGDGQYVAFTSNATNLFGNDTNAAQDVFIRDLVKNTTTAVSVDSAGAYGTVSGGAPASGAFATSPVISSYGGKVYVAFTSTFNTLVATDTNTAQDVFVREIDINDPTKSRTILVSVDKNGSDSGTGSGTGGSFGGTGSFSPLLSQDGRFVAFTSYSNNLVTSDTNGAQDVFVRDLLLNTTTLISQNSAGTDSGQGDSSVPVLSASGGYIAFVSDAGDLVSGDFNNKFDVFGQALLPVVSLTTIDATASETTPASDPSIYQIKRNSNAGELTVKLAIDPTSTAAATDYDLSVDPALATIVSVSATEIILKFLSGTDTIDLKLTPRDDIQAEPDETLKLVITADATNSGYAISTSDNTATTTILANDTVVINTNDSGEGSLRQAIINANAFAGVNTISFAIPGTGAQTIALQSALPILSDRVTIDGTTQTGYINAPLIVLDGAAAGTTSGLHLSAGSSTIQGLAIKNFVQDGILIDTQGGNTIQQNDLSANQGSGVAIVGTITGNRIQGNTFTGNTGLGIDLGNDGVTANDPGDGDSGANDLQNFPVLTIAEPVGTGAAIGGTLNSAPSVQFRVEFFSNDATGTAQGKTFLGFTDVTTDATGIGTFSFTAAGVALGELITATATDASGNTSELSVAKAVVVPTVSLDATPVKLPEGTATSTAFPFIITLSQPSTQSVVVTYGTSDGTATIADSDYMPAVNASITFAPGQTTQTININTIPDNHYEPDETFTVTLNGATNATLTTAVSATGTIQNDDQQPTITIANVSQNETDSGSTPFVFTASLSNLSTEIVTVDYATANGTATLADNDYIATLGSLTFLPGQLTQTFQVLVNGDTKFEPNETFQVTLTNPSNGTIVPIASTATGTILNDDPGPTLSITTPAAQLEGTSGTTTPYLFVVNLSQSSSQEVTVNYATIDDTATIADNDYTAASGTLTFAPNTTSQTIIVFSQGDRKFEVDEQFFVKLTNSNNANLSATDQATGIITSDDTTPPTLQILGTTALEGNSGTTAYNFVVSLSDASYQTITVDYATADQNATIADHDYQAASGTLTFAPNETLKTITVLGNGDNKYEDTETFLVNLSNSSNATISGSVATGTITNDDPLPLVSINDVSNAEGDTGTTKNDLFTVSLSNPTDQTVTVDFATADGTVPNSSATTSDNDYLSASGTVTFNPGEITQTITVVTNGDANFEKDEDFSVNLSNAKQAGILKAQGKGTIVNDDMAPTLKIDSVSQNEGDQNTTEMVFTVSLSATSSDPITVDYVTQDGTATIADNDYQSKTGTLTFAPNTLTQTFAVLVNGDTKLEADETFNVMLRNPSTGALISATEGIGIGTIKNDDLQPTIGIDQRISITEGTSGTLTVSLSNPSTQPVTVHYDSADGTATIADNDYTQVSGTLTFNPGELNKTLTVSTIADTKFEGDEDFTVTLSQAGNADVSVASGQGVITIVDDDSRPTISIDNLSQNEGNSGTTSYVFTASLSNASIETITANYDTSDGSATLADNDYVKASGVITFNPGDLSQKITILANGDTTFEPDENFNVTLSGATKATISAAAGVGKGTLLNDDNPPRPTIRIDGGVTQNEGNLGSTTAYVFNVMLSTSSLQAVTVGYTTKDNSATTLDNDYMAQSGILTFAPGTLSQKITVFAIGDNTLESDESFFIDLQNPSSNADISNADGRGIATLINDDRRPTLNIDSPTQREGASGDITPIEFGVTLSNPTNQTVTVDYGTSNGSATIADNDYTQASGKLTFNPGEVKKTITVSATGDNKFEPDETFTVQLTGANNADITGTGQGTGTLLNDDFAPTISVDSTNASQPENGASPNLFVVTLSNPTAQTVTVNYDTSDGTATLADNDYVRATGTLTFAPTETSKTITVAAVGDTKYESNETFNVNLSNATNATIPVSTISGTIVNDDPMPTISLSAANPSQPEGSSGTTPYVFTATLSNPSSQAITVDYGTADGTATLMDNDYLQATGTLSFAPTETSKTFTVFANGDTKYEDNETFTVSLSNAAIGSMISTQNGSVVATIANDDTRPTISLTPNTLSQPEGNSGSTPYVFTVALSAASSEIITVAYSTADGTATAAGSDYTAVSGKLTFNPGETSKNLTVNAIGDTRFEKDETFQLNLANPTNATLTTAVSATATIVNDDKDLGIISDSGILWRNQQTGDTLLWQLNSTTFAGSSQLPTQAPTWQIEAKGDFNGDGSLDILWRNTATGEINIWLMNGTDLGSIVTPSSMPKVPDLAWKVEGVADFTGDGKLDLLWRNYQTGEIATWNLNGTTLIDASYLPRVPDLSWQIEGIGDFNGDRKADLLWRNDQTGENAIWLLDRTKFSSAVYLPPVADSRWQIEGIGDFNRDGSLDLLWRNKATNEIGTWELNRTAYVTGSLFSTSLDSTWQVQKIGDFNQDGNLDILWRNTQSGDNKIWYLNGTTYATSVDLPTRSDRNWVISDIGDFSGDGSLDLLWHNARSGETDIWKLDSSPYSGETFLPKVPDLGWQVQATGDFNRDGAIDILWRNYRDGTVGFWQMNGPTLTAGVYLPSVTDTAWKIEGVADFDHDGFLDLFWYNDNTGQAAIWTLNGMSLKQGIYLPTPGPNWQVQAIKDFDQDGNVDILWRSQTGQVAIWKMKGTTLVSGTYLPSVPDSNWQIQEVGDFNGDGKPDILWRNYSTGENAIWQMNGMKFEKALYLPSVTDLSWHVEGLRDYNGDGTLDLLWRNYRTGQNAIWLMNSDETTIGLGVYLPRLDPNWSIAGVDDFQGSSIE